MTTPILGMAEIGEASPTAHIVCNTDLRILEAFENRRLVNITTSAPPGSPAESDCYYVLATGTGAWAGHDGEIACYIQGTWVFWPVLLGHKYTNIATTNDIRWSGAAWV